MEIILCQALKKNGEPCKNKAKQNNYCGIHCKKDQNPEQPIKSCITITFGEVIENHVGMQKVGKLAKCGFNIVDLENIKDFFCNLDYEYDLCYLNEYNGGIDADDAYVLIIKKGCEYFLKECNSDLTRINTILNDLEWDKKAFMKGKVVNKKARYNICFGDESQEPDYENGKGRIVKFDDVKELQHIRQRLYDIMGDKAHKLNAEGNLYYDINECGIGFHGDTERKKVIGFRFGNCIKLVFQWYHKLQRIGTPCEFMLEDGDFYIMSEKAVGCDWKKQLIPTLRHAAGCNTYTK